MILPSVLSSGCVGERKGDPCWAPHSVCVTFPHGSKNWGDFLFPLLYLGLWRVTEIIQRLIVLGGGAFHQERENTAQRQCLRLWLSREQSLCCWYS